VALLTAAAAFEAACIRQGCIALLPACISGVPPQSFTGSRVRASGLGVGRRSRRSALEGSFGAVAQNGYDADIVRGAHAWNRRVNVQELQVGQKLTGVVQSIRPFGCFVDVGAERDGLVHITKLRRGWIRNVDDVVYPGQQVTVWVLAVKEDGRLELSMVEKKGGASRDIRNLAAFQGISPSQWLPGTVTSLAHYGAFVDVVPPEGAPARGLVYISRIKDGFMSHPADALSEGQEVQVRVINVDIHSGRLGLSMREVQDDEPRPRGIQDISALEGVTPEEWFTGTVHHTTTFGVFVELVPPGGGSAVMGLVHVTQLPGSFVGDPAAVVRVGQEVRVRVLRLEVYTGRLGLSMREPEVASEDPDVAERP